MPNRVTPAQKEHYLRLRREGWNMSAACREIGVSRNWATKYEKGHGEGGNYYRAARAEANLGEPKPLDRLCKEALKGLEDFEFFRRYYLGHVSTPWQISTANDIVYLLATSEKEYVLVNCPPGVGKTTLIHDIACWMTARDRRLRGLIGSRTETNARRMLGRIKRTLERPLPYKAPTEDIEKGLAVDAKASLAQHYGPFKPQQNVDVWRMDEFVVAQLDNIPIEEKEPTWSSYGLDSGVLSNRFDVIFWDDLIDKRTNRTIEAREALVEKWDEEFESRLEPGGMLGIIGQRLHPEDLYATLRDREIVPDEDQEDLHQKAYHHIVYPAHNEDNCEHIHNPQQALPQPEGCLLDPYRLPWRECRKLMAKRSTWPVVYQQTDGDPSDGWVQKIWIEGGLGPDGIDYPGCWDAGRNAGELPPMSGRTLSIATVDPSPTRYWAIEWWVYHYDSEYRFLMDLVKRPMDADEFFDYNPVTRQYSGVLCDWQERSEKTGHPITHWIVERNAAQRFMLQQSTLRQYRAKHRFAIVPHETTMNKSHPEYGVQSVASNFRNGLVRLPGGSGRIGSLMLVEEALKYGHSSVDDCVMAYWFMEWNLPKLRQPDRSHEPRLKVPSWLKELAS